MLDALSHSAATPAGLAQAPTARSVTHETASDGESRFDQELRCHEEMALRLWRQTPATPAGLGRGRSAWRRWRCGWRLSARVAELESRLASCRPSGSDAVAEGELSRLGAGLLDLLAIDGVDTQLLMRPDMTQGTEDFVRQARRGHPELPAEDLGQALRNFWVVNFFQLLTLGRPSCTESSLGYSLLYPYTDNVLDDPERSASDKRQRSRGLGLRLAGVKLPPSDAAEARVFRQVERVEAEFPRHEFPQIHLALRAIHRHQVASLRQQGDGQLDEDELLRLSVRKGGASVLVDAYLVDGRPSPELACFAFAYGVALQLADDLQDVEEDLAAGHQTLFTRAAARGELEPTFWRLVHFLDSSLGLCPPGKADGTDLPRLARASMVHLMIQAVGAQGVFPSRLRRHLGRHSPVTFRRARSVRRRLARSLSISF